MVGATTTNFALDIAAGLPEVIYTSEGNAYLHLPGVIVAESATGEVRYLLSDGLGSVRQAVDDTGAVVAYNEFDPYGNPVESGGEPYGFTGEWWQNEVELLQLRARWYAVGTGTFLSQDPVESEPPYQYVRGNPVNLTDPSGYYPFEDCKEDVCVIHDVVKFIINRIREDSTTQEIKNIRTLNETHYYENALQAYEQMPWWQRLLVAPDFLRGALDADIGARNLALAQFGCLVADGRSRPLCGQWDYKVEIGRLPPLGWGQAQRIDFCSIGRDEKVIFYYDIWANIHFGYLGKTGGFSDETLLTGADIEQAVSVPGQTRDDFSDKVAAKIGIDLYNRALTEQILLEQVYNHRHELNKAKVRNGVIEEVYR